jgi:hypothetical protein
MKRSLQIILTGWEWDRILYGLKEYPPKKVIFVCPKNELNRSKWGDITNGMVKKMIDRIKDIMESQIVFVNYYDFYDCMKGLSKIIYDNIGKYDDISINISTGTRVLSTAAVLVSQYYPVELFYVVPERYNISKETPFLTSGAQEIVKLPTFNIRELVIPTKRQKEIFENLNDGETVFSELIKRYAQKRGITQTRRKTAELRSALFYHLKKLKDKRLIEMRVEGNRLIISMTNTGMLVRNLMKK